MPQLAVAAATAVSWVTTAVTTSAAVIQTAMVVGFEAIGLSTATSVALAAGAMNVGGALALSAVSTALMQPKTGLGGSPTSFKADPNAPISGVMGRFGVGGRQIHMRTWGKDNLLITYFTALSLGPIAGVQSFTANTLPVTFPGPQGLAANVEPYKDKMWMQYQNGLPTDGAFTLPNILVGSPAMSPAWTAAHKTSGYAMSMWTMQNNSKRASYENGVPRPVWTLHGMLLWDPRKDSTYPGGDGPQRRDDWRTWAYTENPYVHAIAWARGHHKNLTGGLIDRSKRLAGIGAPDAAIDLAAFVAGANVADANGWKIAGEWTTADDKWNVLSGMLQAGGGMPLNRGAQISCMVNAPRAAILNLTGADLAGPVKLRVMASRRDRFNTVIPRYREENQAWEEVAAGPVTSAAYVAEDRGEPRTREISYSYVRQAKQAAELAAYDLANSRESLTGSLPCKPYLLTLQGGDAFTVTEPELGLNGQKFVVIKRGFDPGLAVVTLDVRSETDAKHAWALGQAADPPPAPALTALDQTPDQPGAGEWALSQRGVDAGGTQQPGLILTGAVASDNIGTVLVEYATSAAGPWQQYFSGPPTTTTVPIDGLKPGQAYHVGVTYLSLRGTPSLRRVYGPLTAPGMTAGGIVGQGALATQNAVTEAQLLAAAGDNAVVDPTFSRLDTNWAGRYMDAAFSRTDSITLETWEVTLNGTPANGFSFQATQYGPSGQLKPWALAVRDGQRVEASCWIGFARCDVALFVHWFGNTGSYLTSSAVQSAPNGTPADGANYDEANMVRLGGFVTAPAGARFASIGVSGYGQALANPYYRWKKPVLAAALSGQTTLRPFAAGFRGVPGADPTGSNTAAAVVGQTAWATTSEPLTKISRLRANGRMTNTFMASNGVLSGITLLRSPAYVLGSSVVSSAARVTVNAFTLAGSGVSASYGGGTIDGLAFNTKYSIWAYDPNMAGGAVTYVATTNPNAYVTNDDFLFIDVITTVTSSGGTGASPPPPLPPGGGGVEDPRCVCVDSWLPGDLRAGDVEEGDLLLLLSADGQGAVAGRCEGARPGLSHCFRFTTVSGIELDCSKTTPIPHLVREGVAYKQAQECDGSEILAVADENGFRWEALAGPPAAVGQKRVAMISANNGVYAAGRDRTRFIFTHNIYMKS